jgi:hypothetical protein
VGFAVFGEKLNAPRQFSWAKVCRPENRRGKNFTVPPFVRMMLSKTYKTL